MAADSQRKSPLKDRPLNSPGESLEKEIDNLILDEVLFYGLLTGFMGLLAALEWYRWYKPSEPHPWFYTGIFFIFFGIAAVKTRRAYAKARRLKQGRDGEKAVGQFLEQLRGQGATVFHDVPGGSFNLDHVVIHENGIYVVETKTWSKPKKGQAVVSYDGQSVKMDGGPPNIKPIIQVKAASNWLSEMLASSTGKSFSIQPVVVFPGWYIESAPDAMKDVWVLNPKAFPAFIANAKPTISMEDAKLASFHLSRYIRTAV
jgi:hypothetical protein